jgi:DNA topoisomerase I
MGKSLVIVESPAKARTIARFLGKGFEVESSIGHVRDLPSTAAEIPAKYKGEAWARLGVDVDHQFQPLYVVPREKKTQVKKLQDALRGADQVLLATDEDREGEAIAWHLREVLKPKVPVLRMVFSEITKPAIEQALRDTREIDERLVSAQETRRVLDRLYGYEVSPVLWKKVRPRLSAGRVQSVATRLVVDRERARMAFVPAGYWSVAVDAAAPDREPSFEARLAELDGRRVATGRDFDDKGQLSGGEELVRLDEAGAGELARGLREAELEVAEVKERPFTRRPYPPFITSTLQQEAARKLRFSAQRTMRTAQRLYETGYITYMRTDSVQLSAEAIAAARRQVGELFGDQYLPEQPRAYRGKAKNAQEAHEAIRPAGSTFRLPDEVRGELGEDEQRLYELVWQRTLASQMRDAEGTTTSVRLSARPGGRQATLAASGKVIRFPGFLRVYVEGADDPRAEQEDQERLLPPLSEGESVSVRSATASGHSTQPPPRYTEASLVKELEERGIGRPSTYAAILQTIQDRGYVWKKGSALVPTFTAFAVTRLLEQHMPELVDLEFTARMEDELDAIARGEREAGPYLRDFYFGADADGAVPGLKELIGSGWEGIDAREVCSVVLGSAGPGSDQDVAVRVGRYGPYLQVGQSDRRVTIADDIAPDELTVEEALRLLASAAEGDRPLGNDPESGKPVYLKSGRFGHYVQLGDPELDDQGRIKKKAAKPKMASLWPSMSREELTLQDALLLLSFPREIGRHPESGEAITAQDGRFGPYLKMGTETRSLAGHEELRTVTLQRALELFAAPKAGRRSGGTTLADVGTHPRSAASLVVKSGRFGPYVTDGTLNASLPKGSDPASLSVEEAVALLDARAEKLREQGKDPSVKAPRTRRRAGRAS